MTTDASAGRISTGVDGLDRVLNGGLIPERGYMIRGEPGAGKTILSMHFLTADPDDTALFINLEEDEEDIRRNAEALGFDVDPVHFLDLSPTSDVFTEERSYSIFEAGEVEEESMTQRIIDRVEEVDPDRVVVDPVTQMRYLTPDEYQFRKQVTGCMQFLQEQGATVLFTSQATESTSDDDMQFISHGVIYLRNTDQGRSLRVPKFRGSASRGGWHTVTISETGLEVFPKLSPDVHGREFEATPVSSGVPELDELLHGGIERGTVTILSGPTGVGKTTLGAQFMKESAGRGDRSVIFQFEESEKTFLERSSSINIPVEEMVERGTLRIETVEPLAMSADEFAQRVRTEVEEHGTEVVMIDGTAGYRLSLPGEEDQLVRELHSVCRYLKNMGVTVILVEEIQNITGEFKPTSRNISYMADNIVFLRYLEVQGEMRKTIGVLKKRMSGFERNLREFEITQHGIKVGEPLTNLRGILQGSPELVSERDGSTNRSEME